MKNIVVTGGSGFVGRRLVEALLERGDRVTVLTRDPARARPSLPGGAGVAAWDPAHAGSWTRELEGADAVVHLAGEPVAQRWTPPIKERIVESRVTSTRVIVDALSKLERRPAVLVCASAIGFYGAREGSLELAEDAAPGEGFLADVVKRWEREAKRAAELGVRDVELRIGVVLGEGGGAVDKMILPFKLFAGGPVGDGKQVISWIHRDDVIGLSLLAIDDERARGPINVVAPRAATSAELARAIGGAMRRPSWLPVPSFALRLAMGEAAEVLTTGQRVIPKRAMELGYAFQRAELGPALASIVGRG